MQTEGIPLCSCGGVIKPEVVLYEEALNDDVIKESVELISKAEILIVGGTSLSVYPAAGLIRYYRGNRLVLINKSDTAYDREADLLINTKLGDVFSFL
jgi:NAD-dependent deacetylase